MVEASLSIMQVATSDLGGGAERMPADLIRELRLLGHRCWMAVGYKPGQDSDTFKIPNPEPQRWAMAIHDRLRKANGGWARALAVRATWAAAQPLRAWDHARGRENFHFPGTYRIPELSPTPPQIIHCHNLHGEYFDLRALPQISRRCPTVLTLHDSWLLSGHCAHSFGCERWRHGCGACPDLNIYPAIRRDATRANWAAKQSIFASCQLAVATPSRWLMDRMRDSMLAPAVSIAHVIPNGVDLAIFHPGQRNDARAALGLPQASRVMVVCSMGLRTNPWKDWTTLRAAISMLDIGSDDPLVLVVVGEAGATERIGRVEVRYAGMLTERREIADHYRAADIYVHSARADTYPTTVIESLACGTPVIATSVGGIPEQFINGVEGQLVPPQDHAALAAMLGRLLRNTAALAAMSDAALARRDERGSQVMVHRYLDLYREMMSMSESSR